MGKYKALLCGLIFILCCNNTQGKSNELDSTLRCQVLDAWNEQAISGVMIYVKNAEIISDSLGYFQIQIFSQTELIHFKKKGFYSETFKFETIMHNTTIMLQPIFMMDAISVTGNKAMLSELDVATSISKIDSREFAYKEDLGDLLSREGGIFIKRYGGNEGNKSISMRGLSAEHTLILLDGIPLNKSQTGTVDLDNYYSNMFSEIEIYHGGFSTLFGNGAVGGVVNLGQLYSFKPGLNLSLEKGSYGLSNLRANLGLITGPIQHFITFRRSYAKNDYSYLYNGNSERRSNADFSKSGVNYSAQYQPSQRNKLLLNLITFSDRHGVPRAVTGFEAYQGQARMFEKEFLMRIKWERQNTTNAALSSQLYIRRNWMDYRDNDVSLMSNHFNEDGGMVVNMNLLLNASLHLHGGLQAHSNSIKSSQAGKHARQQIAAHTLLNWIFWQRDNRLATLSVAARNEWYSDYGSIFLPRSGINIILNDWRFFVSAGMNYRVPTLNELYWDPGGNPDLNAEHSTALESGINYTWDAYGLWEFKFSFYYITLKDMIRWHPTQNGIWQPENLDVVSSKGLEIQTKFKIIQERLQGTINYKYGLSILEETSDLNTAAQGKRLPYLPATEINTHIMGNLHHFRLGFEIEYLSYRYITIANLNDQYLPAVTLFNIYADYQYDWKGSTIIIYTRLNNIFKNEYQIINNYPLPIWEWKIGMQFDILNK